VASYYVPFRVAWGELIWYLCGHKVVVGVGLLQHGQQALGGRDGAVEVLAAADLEALQDHLGAVQLLAQTLQLLQGAAGRPTAAAAARTAKILQFIC